MAIVVPIVSEWDPKGIDKSLADIKRAEGGWAKTGAGFRAAFLPASAALAGIGLAAGKWIQEAEGGRQANKRLEQVFRSMGDTTGKAAKQAEDYAGKLGRKIGVDDDDIKATQAKLATFSALSGEVGRQSGLFDRATAAAHDLAAAGFGDAASNAVQLGKALQDPIKGTTALAKSGVTFTAAEKAKIKALQQSGDMLGAQKIVMGAVEHQVGGVAAASVTSSQKMQTAWKETQESLGTTLLPAFDALTGVLQSVADWVQKNSTVAMVLVGVIAALAAVVVAVNVAMKVYTAATRLAAAAQWLWNAAMEANPIGLVVLAVVLLVAAIVLLWKRSQTFRTIVTAVWGAVLAAVRAVWSFVTTVAVGMWRGISATASAVARAVVATWNWLRSTLASIFGWIKSAAAALWAPYASALSAVAHTIASIWQGIWNTISGIVGKIKDAASKVGGIISKIPGLGMVTGNAYVPPSPVAAMPVPMLQRSARAGAAGASPVVVNVWGTLDPQGTARTVQRVLRYADVRAGRKRFA